MNYKFFNEYEKNKFAENLIEKFTLNLSINQLINILDNCDDNSIDFINKSIINNKNLFISWIKAVHNRDITTKNIFFFNKQKNKFHSNDKKFYMKLLKYGADFEILDLE